MDKKEELTSEEEGSATPEKKEVNELKEPAAINLKQAFNLYQKNVLFIDAREPADYESAHIKNAVNLPFDHFDEYKHILDTINKDQTISYIYCGGTDCDLSILLGNLLFEMGYKNVYIFFGGWNEWIEANYPVENGKSNSKMKKFLTPINISCFKQIITWIHFYLCRNGKDIRP
jgi:rhodanese-related sulfurtransferase